MGIDRQKLAAIAASFILTIVIPALVFGMIKVDPSWGWPFVGICLLATGAILIWGFSKHHLTDWRKKMWPIGLMGGGFCVYVAGAIWYFIAHYSAQTDAPPRTAQTTTTEAPKVFTLLPSLPSLFMSDFQGKGSGGGISLLLNGFVDSTLDGKQQFRVFYNLIQDYGSRSKFICFYVTPNIKTFDVINFLATNYKEYLETTLGVETGGAGVQNVTKSEDLFFTGRVFVYYETALSLSQLGQLETAFQQHGASPEFRSSQYALAVADSIRSGAIKPPPQYEVHDNLLRLIPGQKTPQ